tara:strand:+ start:17441 stop:17719 length:279 start_codon:yes stop_codon:yes gene_type:complete
MRNKKNSSIKPPLTPVQSKVMAYLSQGWVARVSQGSGVEINGSRVCNLATMKALQRRGLVEDKTQEPCWAATADGRKLSPSYDSYEDDQDYE